MTVPLLSCAYLSNQVRYARTISESPFLVSDHDSKGDIFHINFERCNYST
jgi:hypothetical protein